MLVLFFGGFLLAHAVLKEGVDKVMTGAILSLFCCLPRRVMLVTILFSTFISNTTAANLLLTFGIAFATGTTDSDSPGAIVLAVGIALAASLAMSLPVSTPPNTIAYSQGRLTSGDFSRPGMVAVVLIVFLGEVVVEFWMNEG